MNTNFNNDKNKTATSQSGKSKLADCKQATVQPSGDSMSTSSEVPLPVVASTSKAAMAHADYESAKVPASGNATSSAVTPATTGTAEPCTQKSDSAVPTPADALIEVPGRNNPNRRVYIKRRAALRIVSSLGPKDAKELSADEKSSIAWAKAFLADPVNSIPPTTAVLDSHATAVGPKRQRSREELTQQNNQPLTKRPRQNNPKVDNRSYSEVAKNPLMRAVINRANSDGSISQDQWRLIRQEILGVYWKILKDNPGTPPQIDDAGWFQGRVKLMACTNERSATLFGLAIASLGEVWPGARLEMVTVDEIPRKPRSITVIPAEPHDPAEILSIIRNSNPDLPSDDWKVVSVSAPENRMRKAVVALNKESLEPLRKTRGKIYYGFDSIILHVYRGDDKPDPVASCTKEVPQGEGAYPTDGTAASDDGGDSQSDSGLVGELLGRLDFAEDEDDLLNSDSENVDVTVIHRPDNGEGDSNKPSPL